MSASWSTLLRDFIRRFFARLKKSEPTTKFILTIWKLGLMNPRWYDHIEGFDAISIKCVDGTGFYRMQDAVAMSSEALERGLELHGWGFHYCMDRHSAVKEAGTAAAACIKLGASAYHWNAEKQWAAGEDPIGTGKLFAQTFNKLLPGVELYANCFSSHASTDLLVFMDRYEPMLYGTRRKTIENKFSNKIVREDVPAEKICAMVGTGRRDANNKTRAWGYLHPSKGRIEPLGLAQLIVKHKPYAINFFRGGMADGEDIMVEGNTINPKLSEQVKEIKALLAAEEIV